MGVMKLLGIDYGTKRIGLAVGDQETGVAAPLRIIDNDTQASNKIAQIIKKKDIETTVIGESKKLSGEENPVMEHIHQFADRLRDLTSADIAFIDESYTSAEARRQPDAPELVDGSAAALILQSYLDQTA